MASPVKDGQGWCWPMVHIKGQIECLRFLARSWWLPWALFLLLVSCTPSRLNPVGKYGRCVTCHQIRLDTAHDFQCTSCHRGDATKYFRNEAHKGLVKSPSSPAHAKRFCARCHTRQVKSIEKSLHYTLKGEIGQVWGAFFPGRRPPGIRDIRAIERPVNDRQLVMDLLARRCLRCHVYYGGDSYSGTMRGKGCAACHMVIGRRENHVFGRPSNSNCLSCHYANFTGWDYVGRFEKDFPEDFRAPLKKGRHISRPYGVEWLQMTPDVHERAGLACIDCHKGKEFHMERPTATVSCRGCHRHLSNRPGHRVSGRCRADCQVCHAAWSVRDKARFLMRQDRPDPEDWQFLEVQGSSEVEKVLRDSYGAENASLFKPSMSDKINGGDYPGLWLEGFEKRRWTPVLLGLDRSGRIAVMRPLLDLSLSYVDETGETIFDNIRPKAGAGWQIVYPGRIASGVYRASMTSFYLPYHPHTVVAADVSRSIFVGRLLKICGRKKHR